VAKQNANGGKCKCGKQEIFKGVNGNAPILPHNADFKRGLTLLRPAPTDRAGRVSASCADPTNGAAVGHDNTRKLGRDRDWPDCGWRGGMILTTTGLSAVGVSVTVGRVMMGLRMYSFIDVMINCLNYVRSVALKNAAFNPSWHLTADGAVSSAIAVHAASRRWLSFFR